MLDKIKALFLSEQGKDIYESAASAVREYGMLPLLSGGVLVGLSGGADSVMLLSFLVEYRRREALDFPIFAVHINHGIRGEEADRDESFCLSLCSEIKIEIISRKYDVPLLAKSNKLGLEEAARNLRYSVFSEIISGRNDISCIAVAHNRSDNAETVIFNILRGCGSRGAGGIRPIRDNIIRPLINVGKEAILGALNYAEIPYVTDSTNLSSDYMRNYVRHEIMPRLNKLAENPEKMISRFAENMRSDDDFITATAEKFLAERSQVTNGDLKSLHYSVFVRVLAIMAEKMSLGISSSIISDIYALLDNDNFSYSLIGRGKFVCERGICRILANTDESFDYHFAIREGVTDLSPFDAQFLLSEESHEKTYLNVYKISIQANLSSAIISGELYLRPKKDGDTVFYGGMTHKLKKLFSDRKIPVSKRRLIPILCDDKGVVWIPGFGVRDDGVSKEERKDLYALLGITSLDNYGRFLLGSEYKT